MRNQLGKTGLLQIILLTSTYYITGKLGLLFALPPGYASLVWPPMGLSIAGLLLFGLNRWPGVFLGAFLVNIKTLPTLFSASLALGIAAGNTLAVVVAVLLIRKFLKYPRPLFLEKDIVLYLIIAGPLSALVSSLCGVGILYLTKEIHGGNFLANFLHWYIGDSTGGIIFAPLALMFSSRSRPYWMRSIPKVIVPLLIFFILIMGSLQYISKVERAKTLTEFATRSKVSINTLQRNFTTSANRLHMLKSFFENSEDVTSHEFREFSKSVIQPRQEMYAVAWAPQDQKNPSIFALEYLESQVPLGSLVGKDVHALPELKSAIEKSLQTKQFEISGKVDLSFFNISGEGLVFIDPVEKFKGILLSIINVNEILKTGTDYLNDPSYRITIEDVSNNNTQAVIWDTFIPSKEKKDFHISPDFTAFSTFNIGDRIWKISVFQDLTLREDSTMSTALFLMSPLVFTFLMCTLLLIVVSRIITVEELVDQKTTSLRELNLQLEKASKTKSEFLANMSHEIRTPLNVLIGITDLLEDPSLSEEKRRYLDISRKAGDSLLNIINDILDISKIEAGLITLEKTEVNLHSLVKDVYEMFSIKCREKKLKLSYEISPEIEHIYLGDPTRIRQILSNLVSNAIKFTHQGGIHIKVALNKSPQRPGNVLFEVSDTGIGIPAEKMPLLFKPFSQADSTITRKYGGTGLGLSISKKLVEMMEGQIDVDSDVLHGSCFRVSLNLPVLRIQLDDTNHLVEKSSTDAHKHEKPLKILIVDDTEDNRTLIRAFLKNTPHEIMEADNGKQAIELTHSLRPDLILMDMQMPVMDGFTATKEIREWERQNHLSPIQIWALTAYALKAEINRSLEVGCNRHLVKPIRRNELLLHIKDLAQK